MSSPTKRIKTASNARYRKIENIGKGNFGYVSKYLDIYTNSYVAIKHTHSVFGEKEAKNLRDIGIRLTFLKDSCSQIPALYKTILENKKVTLIMEHAPGQSLDKYIKDDGGLEKILSYDIFICLTMAMKTVHEFGYIHRDIKPENIMVAVSPFKVMLVDWGFSEKMPETGTITSAHGSPLYQAPESLKPEYIKYTKSPIKICPANDIWSIGVSLFETLTGITPINEKNRDKFAQRLMMYEIDYDNILLNKEEVNLFKRIFTPFETRINAAAFLYLLVKLKNDKID